jgi:hypothetical protein
LLEACDRLKIKDPLQKEWRRVLKDLTPPPTDENGLMVGSDTPFAKSHRHYSHLLSIFPLHVLSPDKPDELALIDRSYKHWIGLEGALAGYSYTGACSIAATLGRGDEALGYLEKFKPFLQPNTMYVEAGPVIETPLSCAESLHNMVLQSWGDTIRIFPAVPSAWKRVAFRDLRAEGAFLVSGLREDGATRFIRIRSLAGEPCQVKTDLAGSLKDGTLQVVSEKKIKVKAEQDGLLRLYLDKGKEVLLRASWGEHE